MRRKILAAMLAAGCAMPAAADDMATVLAEMKRLSTRVEALEKQNTLPPSAGTIEQMLKSMAQRAFADLLQKKVLEALEQASMFG